MFLGPQSPAERYIMSFVVSAWDRTAGTAQYDRGVGLPETFDFSLAVCIVHLPNDGALSPAKNRQSRPLQ